MKKPDYKWRLLAFLFGAFFIELGSRQLYSAALPQIRLEFLGYGVTNAQLGAVGTVFGAVFGLALVAAATSTAAFGERPVTPEALKTLKHSLIHRGDGKGRPDNTMEALLYTWAKGYTPESDIRYTKDGEIVAFHDNKYKGKPVDAYTWEQIREWDVGSYRGAQYATCRPPLWETIFTSMEENPVRKMHIDWKDVPPEKVAEMVRTHGLEKQCWFITKEYDLIKRYKAALPEGQTLHWKNLGNWMRIDFDKSGETEKCEAHMMALFEKAAAENFRDIDNVQLHCQLRYDAEGNPTFCPRPETIEEVRRAPSRRRGRSVDVRVAGGGEPSRDVSRSLGARLRLVRHGLSGGALQGGRRPSRSRKVKQGE